MGLLASLGFSFLIVTADTAPLVLFKKKRTFVSMFTGFAGKRSDIRERSLFMAGGMQILKLCALKICPHKELACYVFAPPWNLRTEIGRIGRNLPTLFILCSPHGAGLEFCDPSPHFDGSEFRDSPIQGMLCPVC